MNVDIIESCVEKCSEGKPLPSSIVFTPPSIPPFPGDRNPKREGLTNLLELLAAKFNDLKKQS